MLPLMISRSRIEVATSWLCTMYIHAYVYSSSMPHVACTVIENLQFAKLNSIYLECDVRRTIYVGPITEVHCMNRV